MEYDIDWINKYYMASRHKIYGQDLSTDSYGVQAVLAEVLPFFEKSKNLGQFSKLKSHYFDTLSFDVSGGYQVNEVCKSGVC